MVKIKHYNKLKIDSKWNIEFEKDKRKSLLQAIKEIFSIKKEEKPAEVEKHKIKFLK